MAASHFALEIEPCEQKGVTLAASGDIDMTASREFGRRLESALRTSSGGVVLDLRRVVHLDSTALRSLLACRHVAEARGSQLVLVCSRRPVRQVLEVTGLIRGPLRPREAALEAIARPTQPRR